VDAVGATSRSAPPIRAERLALLFALLAGVIARIVSFVQAPALDMDESMFALDVLTRGFIELTGPLDMLQTAPWLFLWLEKVAVLVGGVSEYSLRAIPLVAGIAIPILVWLIGRRVFSDAETAVAVSLTSFGPILLRYSNVAKQYSCDAAVTLLILWLTLRWIDRASSRSRAATLAVVALLAPWLSYVAAFAVAGMICALWFSREGRARRGRLLPLTVAWLVNVAAALLLQRDPSTSALMKEVWLGGFITPDMPGLRNLKARVGELLTRAILFSVPGQYGGLPAVMLRVTALVAILAGSVSLLRRRPVIGVAVIAPIAAGAGASLLGQYPVGVRIWVFAMPLMIVLFVRGAGLLVDAARLPARDGLIAGVGLLVVTPAMSATYATLHSPEITHVREIIVGMKANRRPEEPVYIYPRSLRRGSSTRPTGSRRRSRSFGG
jgi:hypothetical protein